MIKTPGAACEKRRVAERHVDHSQDFIDGHHTGVNGTQVPLTPSHAAFSTRRARGRRLRDLGVPSRRGDPSLTASRPRSAHHSFEVEDPHSSSTAGPGAGRQGISAAGVGPKGNDAPFGMRWRNRNGRQCLTGAPRCPLYRRT